MTPQEKASKAVEVLTKHLAELNELYKLPNYSPNFEILRRWKVRVGKDIEKYVNRDEAIAFAIKKVLPLNMDPVTSFFDNFQIQHDYMTVLIQELRNHGSDFFDETPTVTPAGTAVDGGTPHLLTLLHPSVRAEAAPRFESKQFADAVVAALKDVNVRVKAFHLSKTNRELDGAKLMFEAMGGDSPTVVFENRETETGRSIQEGYTQIFAGAMKGIRNPKAHANVKINSAHALHLLFVASHLMYKLDEAGVPLS